MSRSNLDERQRQKQIESGNRAFWVMIGVGLILQIYTLFFTKDGDVGKLNLIVWLGILVYQIGNIKEGIWDSKTPVSLKGSLLFSICFSGILTIAYWAVLIMQKKAKTDIQVNKMAGICFLVVFGVSFLIYYGIGKMTEKWKEKNESKYADD